MKFQIPKIKISERVKEYWENSKRRFYTTDSLVDIERFVVRHHVIASSSLDEYISGSPPPKSRIIMAWGRVIFLWVMIVIWSIGAYYDDSHLYVMLGIPIHFIKNGRFVVILIVIGFLTSVTLYMIILISERRRK